MPKKYSKPFTEKHMKEKKRLKNMRKLLEDCEVDDNFLLTLEKGMEEYNDALNQLTKR